MYRDILSIYTNDGSIYNPKNVLKNTEKNKIIKQQILKKEHDKKIKFEAPINLNEFKKEINIKINT